MEYIDELVDYLSVQIERQIKELKKFEKVVDKLPARERSVIKGRYIANMEFKEIAKKLPYSDRTIYHAHRDGIAKLDMSELD